MNSIILYCSCPDSETAEKIARSLVKDKFAACVSLFNPVTSIYSWQGNIEQAQEVILMIKSSEHRYTDIEKRILDLHPYELPEIIAVPVKQGLPGYLDWIKQCTQ